MPLAELRGQLELFGERIGRDVAVMALELVREYAPVTASERWLRTADGYVAVHGEHPLDLNLDWPRRAVAADLQARGIAAAPVLTPEEAFDDSGLPRPATRSKATAFRAAKRPRVLDLTHLLAGPFATYLLTLAGVDVLKVERPATGDPLRHGEPKQFARLNSGKRRITLDLMSGRDLLWRLALEADLVVHNFQGVRFQELPAPVLSMPSLAAAGPYAGYRGYADTVHAMLGFSHLAGPAQLPWADYLAGAWAANRALDILAAYSPASEALQQAACMPSATSKAWPRLDRRTPAAIAEPPLGEHTDEVCSHLGLDEAAINQLYLDGII
jgi:crotonobetainyl-CoA:carnitine CoA-transferase CaiB-like acyl-CoA transferase